MTMAAGDRGKGDLSNSKRWRSRSITSMLGGIQSRAPDILKSQGLQVFRYEALTTPVQHSLLVFFRTGRYNRSPWLRRGPDLDYNGLGKFRV